MSKRTISAFSCNSSMTDFIRCELSSSFGFGGTIPAGTSDTRAKPLGRTTSCSLELPTIRLDNPGSVRLPFGRKPKRWCSDGRRKSESTIRTRGPAWAMMMPRLTTVVVLPSRGEALVTTTVLTSRSTLLKLMFARSVRYASAKWVLRVSSVRINWSCRSVTSHLLLRVVASGRWPAE